MTGYGFEKGGTGLSMEDQWGYRFSVGKLMPLHESRPRQTMDTARTKGRYDRHFRKKSLTPATLGSLLVLTHQTLLPHGDSHWLACSFSWLPWLTSLGPSSLCLIVTFSMSAAVINLLKNPNPHQRSCIIMFIAAIFIENTKCKSTAERAHQFW